MESIVEEANKHCPIKLKGMGKIESLEFENNTLTYNCLVTTRNFNLSAMEGHEEEMKYAFLTMLPDILNSKGNEAITKKLIDDNSSLAFHLYSKGIKNPRLKGPRLPTSQLLSVPKISVRWLTAKLITLPKSSSNP